MPARRFAPWLVACAWLAYFGVLQWSVVRLVAIAHPDGRLRTARLVVGHRDPRAHGTTHGPWPCAGAAVVGLAVPLWSWRRTAGSGRHGSPWPSAPPEPPWLWAAIAPDWPGSLRSAPIAASVIAITTDHRPKIDVWVILQQSSDALARFENFYTMTWTGSPGIKDAYTYSAVEHGAPRPRTVALRRCPLDVADLVIGARGRASSGSSRPIGV